MANEYEQYGLISQIMNSGHGAEGILNSYREGVKFKDDQEAHQYDMQIKQAAIKQAQANLDTAEIQNKQRQIEVDDLLKKQPLIDAQIQLELEKTAHEKGLETTRFKFATLKLNDELNNYPIEERAKHLQALDQVLTSFTPDNYGQMLKDPNMQEFAKEFQLTGDYKQDQPTLKAIHAASMQVPSVQAALINKAAAVESAKTVAEIKAKAQVDSSYLRGGYAAGITSASRERVAAIMGDYTLRGKAISAAKLLTPKKNDVLVAKAQIVGDPDFSGLPEDQQNRLASELASMTLGLMQAGKGDVDYAEAQAVALTQLKAASVLAPKGKGFVDSLLGLVGLGETPSVPSISQVRNSPKGAQAEQPENNIKAIAASMGVPYQPDKYEYKIVNGKLYSKAK